MQLASDEAFILETRDLSDGDRLVVFFTRSYGTKRGAAKGAKRRFSRFAGQLQPLAKVKIEWMEKEGRELVRMRSVELIRPADKLLEGLEGILLACYLAELIEVFAADSDADPVLFRLIDATVVALLDGVDQTLAARYFEVWILRLAGILPMPSQCPECYGPLEGGAVLPPAGDYLVCRSCGAKGGGISVDESTLALLRMIHRLSLKELALRPLNSRRLARLEFLVGTMRRSFLQHELKSYEVMKNTLE